MQVQTDQINIRIDTDTKMAAEAVFNQLGLSATDAVRMFYRQVAMRRGLPFEARIIETPSAKQGKDMQKIIKASIRKHKAVLKDLAGR